jgi:hypothetical protein
VDLHFAKDRSYVEFATKNQAIFQHNASAGKRHQNRPGRGREGRDTVMGSMYLYLYVHVVVYVY